MCGGLPLSTLPLSLLPAHCLSPHFLIYSSLALKRERGRESTREGAAAAVVESTGRSSRAARRRAAEQHGGDLQGVEYIMSCHVMSCYSISYDMLRDFSDSSYHTYSLLILRCSFTRGEIGARKTIFCTYSVCVLNRKRDESLGRR